MKKSKFHDAGGPDTVVSPIAGTPPHQAPDSRLALAPSECAHSTSHQPLDTILGNMIAATGQTHPH